ncbi:response regulator transcription factor [Brevundimonas sp.]|uniref:response regulator transcription factor n=1 Tax=Brevundimonas sp. TaxID=1871086 RepID=UPI001D53D283|nr:response regulator transcription factor [Brevundimonas sp.]MBA4001273.1 DNA-binding response regulator [Brevundimonas sp.]
MKVALLDDDANDLALLTRAVEGMGHAIVALSRAEPLIAALRRDTVDLIILDWNLPDRSGLEVVRWVRMNLDPPPPMLLVTSRADDQDVIAGLSAGADDYLTKPLAEPLLAARIEALLRRAYPARRRRHEETHAGVTFEPLNMTARIHGAAVQLTAKEFALALVLFRNLHRALSRSYLIEAVWGVDPGVNSRSLDMHVSRVRTKLRLRPEHGFRLTPVYSYGYRLESLGAEGL